uniref:Predicted protein n=1 Tax=Physcomitrium patens TaxID=3218 RepID=A9U5Q2_PHYPA
MTLQEDNIDLEEDIPQPLKCLKSFKKRSNLLSPRRIRLQYCNKRSISLEEGVIHTLTKKKLALISEKLLEDSRDLLLEGSRSLSLEGSRNLALEGSKDYVPNTKERTKRSQARNLLHNERDRKLKKKHRQIWIKPWLHASQNIRSYPEDDRPLIFQKYILLKKLPRALAGSAANSPANLSKPLTENEEGTEELGIPLGIFSIGNTSDPNKTGSEDRHKSLANKDQFRVYENLSFSPHIQPVKLFGDNNNQSGRLGRQLRETVFILIRN